jgi:diguanylate cyclase (GGDEF)-like protein
MMTKSRNPGLDARPPRPLFLFATRFRFSTRRLSILLALTLALLTALTAAFVINAAHATRQHREAERWYVHTLSVLIATGDLRASVYSALRGERGFLLTGDPKYLGYFNEGQQQTVAVAKRLEGLTVDNPRQGANLALLDTGLTDYYQFLTGTIRLKQQGRADAAIAMIRRHSGSQLDGLLASIGKIEDEERNLLASRKIDVDKADQRAARHDYELIGLGVLLLLGMATAGILAIRAQARAMKAAADLRWIATTDELTGLPNRRAFLAALEAESARAERQDAQLWVTIIDVDRFKRINDNYGHPAGDDVLRSVAAIVRTSIRGNDLLGRIGGEEFAVLMPETTRDQAQMVSERFRRAVETTPFVLPSGEVISVTLSAGLAARGRGEDPTTLLSRTDIALYAAKRDGRNLVRLAA